MAALKKEIRRLEEELARERLARTREEEEGEQLRLKLHQRTEMVEQEKLAWVERFQKRERLERESASQRIALLERDLAALAAAGKLATTQRSAPRAPVAPPAAPSPVAVRPAPVTAAKPPFPITPPSPPKPPSPIIPPPREETPAPPAGDLEGWTTEGLAAVNRPAEVLSQSSPSREFTGLGPSKFSPPEPIRKKSGVLKNLLTKLLNRI